MNHVVSLLLGGDVSGAETWYRGLGRVPVGGEFAAVRNACARWGVDPARFGVPPRPPCPPELWPLRASLLLEPVPAYPLDGDFQAAAMTAANRYPDPTPTWRLEAVRWRMTHPAAPLDLPAIEAMTRHTLTVFDRRAGASH